LPGRRVPFARSMLWLLLYNATLLCLDGVLLLALKRHRGPLALCGSALLLAGAALPLAVGLGSLAPPGRRMFEAMAYLAWAVFVHAPVGLFVVTALWRRTAPSSAWLACALGSICVYIGADAFFFEPSRLEVSRHRLSSSKISRRLRVVVVADLQTDHVGSYERSVLVRALVEQPDLILLAGDYLQVDDPEAYERERDSLNALLRELEFGAPLGAFAVRGNVDPPGWERIFEGTDVRPLGSRTRVELAALDLIGLGLKEGFQTGLQLPSRERFQLVFGHAPDFSLSPAVQADLLVAGHCHGGQVRLPGIGPLVKLSAIPRAWTEGLREVRSGTSLLVSRGIGMERSGAPQLRFRCRPELVVIDLVPRAD